MPRNSKMRSSLENFPQLPGEEVASSSTKFPLKKSDLLEYVVGHWKKMHSNIQGKQIRLEAIRFARICCRMYMLETFKRKQFLLEGFRIVGYWNQIASAGCVSIAHVTSGCISTGCAIAGGDTAGCISADLVVQNNGTIGVVGDVAFVDNMWAKLNLWRKNIKFELVSVSAKCISFTVKLDQDALISGVYASTLASLWEALWAKLKNVPILNHPYPWLVAGDFNCIIGAGEKMGGPDYSYVNGAPLHYCFSLCDLVPNETLGRKLTWTNLQSLNTNIQLWLDIAMCNME